MGGSESLFRSTKKHNLNGSNTEEVDTVVRYAAELISVSFDPSPRKTSTRPTLTSGLPRLTFARFPRVPIYRAIEGAEPGGPCAIYPHHTPAKPSHGDMY
ncbi:hypothetical protein E2C01_093009 [Portunus trituberculatus]|uniref:Uncharacterized protein n=1 Tax=Portunus trituberculatus TaxID=210409 RepID=A0A5B7JZF7_PORTR|nr:hypothetical protein [Portunus trituberculatus]